MIDQSPSAGWYLNSSGVDAQHMKHTRARREPRHGSNSSTRSSRSSYQILVALVIVVVQLATAFVADVPATWSQRSSRASSTSTRITGPRTHHQGCNSEMTYAMRPGKRKHSRHNDTPPTKSPRAAMTELRVAGEDQQHHRRQHLQQHDDDAPRSSRAWSTAANDTTTTTAPASRGSSSSGSSSTTVKPPVLPVVGDIRRVNMDALQVRPRSPEGDVESAGSFVELFRASAPYIRAHLGAVMVIHMGGELLEDPNFLSVMDDLGLLRLLGVSDKLGMALRFSRTACLKFAIIAEERQVAYCVLHVPSNFVM